MTLATAPPSSVLLGFATAGALAAACAVLSVFVVSRRWAFIGEGISHSGFGGAGTAWLLALAVPALDRPWVPYAGVVVFCLATALVIGVLERGQRINSDAAVGIFLVASVAWGMMAQKVYVTHRPRGGGPPGWETFFFGRMEDVSGPFALAATLVCLAVVAAVAALFKEIVYYCFDPAMAQASGVRAGFVHYLLMLLVALTIVVGAKVAGNVLVPALLVLPGATAMLLTDRLRATLAASVVVGLVGAFGGLAVRLRWGFLPAGPAIVLVLFAEFVLAYAVGRFVRR